MITIISIDLLIRIPFEIEKSCDILELIKAIICQIVCLIVMIEIVSIGE